MHYTKASVIKNMAEVLKSKPLVDKSDVVKLVELMSKTAYRTNQAAPAVVSTAVRYGTVYTVSDDFCRSTLLYLL